MGYRNAVLCCFFAIVSARNRNNLEWIHFWRFHCQNSYQRASDFFLCNAQTRFDSVRSPNYSSIEQTMQNPIGFLFVCSHQKNLTCSYCAMHVCLHCIRNFIYMCRSADVSCPFRSNYFVPFCLFVPWWIYLFLFSWFVFVVVYIYMYIVVLLFAFAPESVREISRRRFSQWEKYVNTHLKTSVS